MGVYFAEANLNEFGPNGANCYSRKIPDWCKSQQGDSESFIVEVLNNLMGLFMIDGA